MVAGWNHHVHRLIHYCMHIKRYQLLEAEKAAASFVLSLCDVLAWPGSVGLAMVR